MAEYKVGDIVRLPNHRTLKYKIMDLPGGPMQDMASLQPCAAFSPFLNYDSFPRMMVPTDELTLMARERELNTGSYLNRHNLISNGIISYHELWTQLDLRWTFPSSNRVTWAVDGGGNLQAVTNPEEPIQLQGDRHGRQYFPTYTHRSSSHENNAQELPRLPRDLDQVSSLGEAEQARISDVLDTRTMSDRERGELELIFGERMQSLNRDHTAHRNRLQTSLDMLREENANLRRMQQATPPIPEPVEVVPEDVANLLGDNMAYLREYLSMWMGQRGGGPEQDNLRACIKRTEKMIQKYLRQGA